MTHIRRALPLLLLLPAVVTSAACGTESANRPELEARARALGIERGMVYVTDVPGYTLANQSVGVIGDHGYGASYFSPSSGSIEMRVDERRGDPVACTDPDTRPEAERGSCERDGESWYRATDAGHEYVFQDGGRVIRLSGDRAGVTRDALRQAAENAHQADDRELADVLPTTGAGPGPVERGDLPANGDVAPQDPFEITAGTSG
ncbi:hypothetical protein ACFWVC_07220 [Streptomyces sp. NPDC058691]|uniref:hypothetical protein n=1 Tax=Streptomyces sp. NPDC058691 TaxID=3346601 RepID=UPI00365BB260